MTHHKSVICSGQSNLMHVDGMLSPSADPYESEKAFDLGLVWPWPGTGPIGQVWDNSDIELI